MVAFKLCSGVEAPPNWHHRLPCSRPARFRGQFRTRIWALAQDILGWKSTAQFPIGLQLQHQPRWKSGISYIMSTLCYNERNHDRAGKNLAFRGEFRLTWTERPIRGVHEINRHVCNWLHCLMLQKHAVNKKNVMLSRAQTQICTGAFNKYPITTVLTEGAFGCFSICVLMWSCMLVFSLSVIINCQSSIPILKNASIEDTWKCPDVFLKLRMHWMQTWVNQAVRNPRRRYGA